MPIEIKELVIRAVVQPGGSARGDEAGSAAGVQTGAGEEDRAAIVSAAVREVLRILKTSKER